MRNRLIDTDAILPDTGQPIPRTSGTSILDCATSGSWTDGWTAGGGVSIGSASDHPFAATHEMNFGMNAMLRVPQGEHNAWIFP